MDQKKTGIEINTQGARHLGAAAGSLDFKRIYVKKKINNWIELVKQLALIAKTEPHAAFVAYTHSLQCQWTFISRVMDGIADLFEPLENAITAFFLKALLDLDINGTERELISLPARLGGLGMVNPSTNSIISHENFTLISAAIFDLITCQATDFNPADLYDDIKQLRLEVDLNND